MPIIVRHVLVFVLLLASFDSIQANVATPIYRDDPYYQSALFSKRAVPFVILAAVALAIVWFLLARSRGGKFWAVVFGTLVLISSGVNMIGLGTIFPDEGPTDAFLIQRGPLSERGITVKERRMTVEERAVTWILLSAATSCAGFYVTSLFSRRRKTSQTKVRESSPPRSSASEIGSATEPPKV